MIQGPPPTVVCKYTGLACFAKCRLSIASFPGLPIIFFLFAFTIIYGSRRKQKTQAYDGQDPMMQWSRNQLWMGSQGVLGGVDEITLHNQ